MSARRPASRKRAKWMGETARYTPSVIHLICSVAARWSTRARFHSTSTVRFPAVARWAVRLIPMALAIGLATRSATAADLYWDQNGPNVGSGGTGDWNTTSKLWSQSNNDVAGPYQAWINNALTPDNAIFGTTTGTTVGTITLTEGITAHNLTFQSVHNWVVSGNTLTLGGTAPTITTIGNTTINSIIAGTSGLIKSGSGQLSLTGANTFSGGITLSGGTLAADDDAALGALSNNVSVTAGSTLSIGTGTTARTVSIDSGVTLLVSGAGVASALLTGDGNVNVNVNTNLTNNASTYTGTTRFNGCNGVCASTFTSIGNLGEASALGAPTTVANGTITFAQSSQYSDSLIYAGDGDSSNRNWTVSGNAASIRNRGTGTLTLTGGVAVSGGTTFSAELADFEVLGVLSGEATMDLAPALAAQSPWATQTLSRVRPDWAAPSSCPCLLMPELPAHSAPDRSSISELRR